MPDSVALPGLEEKAGEAKGGQMTCPECWTDVDEEASSRDGKCPACGTQVLTPDRARTATNFMRKDSSIPIAHPGEQSPSGPAIEVSDATVNPGTFFGNYRVLGRLGGGGMGEVYEAEQQVPKRLVALKILPLGRLATPQSRSRFLREAAAGSCAKHPYIVSVLESGEDDDGTLYFAMELVKGRPLGAYIADQKPPLCARLRLLIKICEGVQAAHESGVVHRDLKPENIIVDRNGDPHILDFGLAKLMTDVRPSLPSISDEGQIMGTLAYMAPEQAGGRGEEVDPRTDVYALGVILYNMVTAHFPYVIDDASGAVLQRICSEEPVRPRAAQRARDGRHDHVSDVKGWASDSEPVPSVLEKIALKALAKDREERYQSPAELADDLRCFLGGKPTTLATVPVRQHHRTLPFRTAANLFAAGEAMVSASFRFLHSEHHGGKGQDRPGAFRSRR